MADGKVIIETKVDDSKVDKGLDDVEKKLKNSTKDMEEQSEKSGSKIGESLSSAIADKFSSGSKKIEEVADSMGLKVGSGFLAAGAAVAGIGVAGVNVAADMDKAMGNFVASTGTAIEETERYQGILEDIYANNYGDSFEDIADTMALVKQQMGDLGDEELQKVVESAYLLRDTFDMDINESIRGANSIMKEFGSTGEEAYNLIAQGAQKGLNQNQDLADQVAEYSVYYSDLGFTAEEMFNAMSNGIETGAYQVDFLNDAIKEFGIRAKDNSKSTREAFESLGLDADEMTKKFAEGGEESREAFAQVAEALINTKDEVKQNEIGVALFGTKWEDLGVDAVKALTDTNGAIDETKNKLGEMEEVKYDNLGDMFETLKRSIELLLIPLGEALMPILLELIDAILPIFQEVLPPIAEALSLFLEPIMTLVETLLPPLIELFNALIEPLMLILEEIITPLTEALGILLEPIIALVEELMPILIELFNSLIKPLIELFESVIPPIIDILVTLIDIAIRPLIDIIKTLMPIIELLLDVFSTVFGGIVKVVGGAIGTVMDILGEILEFIVNVFTGDWKGAWENIRNIFDGIIGGLGGIFKGVINTIVDGINTFIRGINRINIPDWVPIWGGRSINIPTIPRLKVGMDYVPSDDFPALLHRGEAVLTSREADIYRSLGGNLESLLATPQVPSMDMYNNYESDFDMGGLVNAINTLANRDIVLDINGREFARATGEDMSIELNSLKNISARAKGVKTR